MKYQVIEATETKAVQKDPALDLIKKHASVVDYFRELAGKGVVQEVLQMHNPSEHLFYFKHPNIVDDEGKKFIRVSELEGTFVDFSKKTQKDGIERFVSGDIFSAAKEFEEMSFPDAIIKFESGLDENIRDAIETLRVEAKKIQILNQTEGLEANPHEITKSFIKRLGLGTKTIAPFVDELHIRFFNPEQKAIVEGHALGFKTNEGIVMNVISNDKKLYLSSTPEVSVSTVDVGDPNKEAKLFSNFIDFLSYKNLYPKEEYKAIILHAGIYNAPLDVEKATDQVFAIQEEMSRAVNQDVVIQAYLPTNDKSQEILKSINDRFAQQTKPELNIDDDLYRNLGFRSIAQYCAQRAQMTRSLQYISTKNNDPNILKLLAAIINNTFSERQWLQARNIKEAFKGTPEFQVALQEESNKTQGQESNSQSQEETIQLTRSM